MIIKYYFSLKEKLLRQFITKLMDLNTVCLTCVLLTQNLKAGQKVRYRDIDGELVETFVMTNSLSFCGGDYNNPDAWESTISSVHLNETSTTY